MLVCLAWPAMVAAQLAPAPELEARFRANTQALADSPNDPRLLAERVRLMQAMRRAPGMADAANRLLAVLPEGAPRQEARLLVATAFSEVGLYQRANSALTHYLNRSDEARVRLMRNNVRAAWGDHAGQLADIEALLTDEAWVANRPDLAGMLRVRQKRIVETFRPRRIGPVYPLVLALRKAPEDEARRDAVADAVIALWNDPDHPLHTELVGRRPVHALLPEPTLEELDAPPKTPMERRLDTVLGTGTALPFRRAMDAMRIALPEAQAEARRQAQAQDKSESGGIATYRIRRGDGRFKLADEVSRKLTAGFPLTESYYRWGKETLWEALRRRADAGDPGLVAAKRRLAIAAALHAADAYEHPGRRTHRTSVGPRTRATEAYWLSAFIDRWSAGRVGVFEAEAAYAWAAAYEHENGFRLLRDLGRARLRALAAYRAGRELPVGEINFITELADTHRAATQTRRLVHEGLIMFNGVVNRRPPDLEAAESYLEILQALAPEDLPELDVAAAELAKARGDLAACDRLLDQALAKKPDLARALVVRANVLREAGQKDQALLYLWAAAPFTNSTAELYPSARGGLSSVHKLAVWIEQSLGLKDPADYYLKTFNRLIRQDVEANAALLYGIGVRLYKEKWTKRDDTAVNNLLLFAGHLGSYRAGHMLGTWLIAPSDMKPRAQAYQLAAYALLADPLRDRDDEARRLFVMATQFDPRFTAAFSGLAFAEERLENPDNARAAINRAIELGSTNPGDFLLRARMHVQAKRPAEARRDLDRARRLLKEQYPGRAETAAFNAVLRSIERLERELRG